MANSTTRLPHVAVTLTNQVEEFATLTAGDSKRGIFKTAQVDSFHTTEPGRLLDYVALMFRAAGEGNLVVDRVPAYVFDDGNDAQQLRHFAELAKLHGWEPGAGMELGSGWLSWFKEGMPTVHMTVRRMLPEDDPMRLAKEAPEKVIERLCRYAALIGAAYRATPGVSGIAALRNLYDRPRLILRNSHKSWAQRAQPRWSWTPPVDVVGWGCGDLRWQRKPTAWEAKAPHVLAFDVRAMYLAAAAGVKLAWNMPQRTGAIMWEPSLSGYFRIAGAHLWADASRGVPVINPNRIAADGTAWVTAPILAYIDEAYGERPDILDSYTAPGKVFLREWCETLRDAAPDFKHAGDPALRTMVKSTYVESFGMMAAPGGRVQRRDWHASVIDEARVRLLRKVKAVAVSSAVWPLKIKTDAVWYAADDPDPAKWLRAFGQDPEEPARIGQFTFIKKDSMSMKQWLEAAH